MPDIASAGAPLVNPARDAAVISAVPRSAPAASVTTALVKSIRSLAPSLEQSDGVRVYVTGTTALNIDVPNKLASALPLYLVVVIGLALLLLRRTDRSRGRRVPPRGPGRHRRGDHDGDLLRLHLR